VWRLGQSGLVVRLPSATVVIDPYLSNHCEAVLAAPFDHRRLTRSPLDPVELDMVDLLICSHDHLDHLDPPTVRTLGRQNPDAVVAAPRTCVPVLRGLGWDPSRILAFDDGDSRKVGGVRISAFAVPHDDFDEGPDGHPYLGWVLDDGAVRVAHLGDARTDPRLVTALAEQPVDLLAAPINGRDERRAAMGFAGNMSATEVVDLAVATGALLTLPMHYDMFAQNVDAGALEVFESAADAAGAPFEVLPVGRRLSVVADG
jgi:L-ascorbate metabolism protein UlaG (beta-lactamase superfamily)